MMDQIVYQIGLIWIEVEGVVSFYLFLLLIFKGWVMICLCDDIVDCYVGFVEVVVVFERELGIRIGEILFNGVFFFEYMLCIGMCDQVLVVMINDVVLIYLMLEIVWQVVWFLKGGQWLEQFVSEWFVVFLFY